MSIVGRTSGVDLVEPFDPGNEVVITRQDRRVSMVVDTRSMSRKAVCVHTTRSIPDNSLFDLFGNLVDLLLGSYDYGVQVALDLFGGGDGVEYAIVEFSILVLDVDEGGGVPAGPSDGQESQRRA